MVQSGIHSLRRPNDERSSADVIYFMNIFNSPNIGSKIQAKQKKTDN